MKRRSQLLSVPLAAALTLATVSGAQAQEPANFHASRIETGSHNYTLLMQGNPLGTMVVSATVEDGLISAHNQVAISVQGMNQTITADVRFYADGLRMISSSNMFDLGMMQAQTTLEYSDGRVTGRGQLPGPGGITSAEIDTVIGADVIDSGAMILLLSTVDWTDGASYSFSVFEGSTGHVAEGIATVEGSESLSVPEGTFDAWRINIAGVQQAIHIWIAKDGGTVLKLAPVGAPVEIVLGTVAAPPLNR